MLSLKYDDVSNGLNRRGTDLERAKQRDAKTNDVPVGRESYKFLYDENSREVTEKPLKLILCIVAFAAAVDT